MKMKHKIDQKDQKVISDLEVVCEAFSKEFPHQKKFEQVLPAFKRLIDEAGESTIVFHPTQKEIDSTIQKLMDEQGMSKEQAQEALNDSLPTPIFMYSRADSSFVMSYEHKDSWLQVPTLDLGLMAFSLVNERELEFKERSVESLDATDLINAMQDKAKKTREEVIRLNLNLLASNILMPNSYNKEVTDKALNNLKDTLNVNKDEELEKILTDYENFWEKLNSIIRKNSGKEISINTIVDK